MKNKHSFLLQGYSLANRKIRKKETEKQKQVGSIVQNPELMNRGLQSMNDAIHKYALTLPSLFHGLMVHFNHKSVPQTSLGEVA